MSPLDQLYVDFLFRGFILLRNAIESGDAEWTHAELEVLHNAPSLIGENNVLRHKYFWEVERTTYIEWATSRGEGQIEEMEAYYQPVWEEMKCTIEKLH